MSTGTQITVRNLENASQEAFGIANADTRKLEKKNGSLVAERDAEIIEYCAQMKFVSMPLLIERFFKWTLTGALAKSDLYAKERIYALAKAGYLQPNISVLCLNRYYSATMKGYQTAQSVMPFRDLTRPIIGFDVRTFIHDRELTFIRHELESSGQIQSWISDRRLRMGKASAFYFSNEMIPDAVIKMLNGNFESLELEISTKAKSRYQEKVQFYVNLIRDKWNDPIAIKRVQFICMREPCFKILEDECRPYGEMFSVIQRAAPLDLGSDS